MTPAEKKEFEQMKADIAMLLGGSERRKLQQIDYPLDEGSVNTLGALVVLGTDVAPPDQEISVPSTPATFDVPAAPGGILIVRGPDGVVYSILLAAT